MRSFISTVIGTKGNVSVGRRNRSIVTGTYVLGVLRALEDVRFLLAWLTRHVQAALAVVDNRHAKPAAHGVMWAPEPTCSGVATSRSGLGGPGSGIPSGRF